MGNPQPHVSCPPPCSLLAFWPPVHYQPLPCFRVRNIILWSLCLFFRMESTAVRMRNTTLSFLWVIYVSHTICLLHIAPTFSYLSEFSSLRKPDSKWKPSEKNSLYMIYMIIILCHENCLYSCLKFNNDFFLVVQKINLGCRRILLGCFGNPLPTAMAVHFSTSHQDSDLKKMVWKGVWLLFCIVLFSSF